MNLSVKLVGKGAGWNHLVVYRVVKEEGLGDSCLEGSK